MVAVGFSYIFRGKGLQLVGIDLSKWRLAWCGAEPIRQRTMAAFTDRFATVGLPSTALYPCYGLAEATLIVSGCEAGTGWTAERFDPAGLGQRRGDRAPVGTPLIDSSNRGVIKPPCSA